MTEASAEVKKANSNDTEAAKAKVGADWNVFKNSPTVRFQA